MSDIPDNTVPYDDDGPPSGATWNAHVDASLRQACECSNDRLGL